jgi:hypothetical protein
MKVSTKKEFFGKSTPESYFAYWERKKTYTLIIEKEKYEWILTLEDLLQYQIETTIKDLKIIDKILWDGMTD